MRIAFATTQSITGSTNVGRILPLAEELTRKGVECFVLVQAASGTVMLADKEPSSRMQLLRVGTVPFRRIPTGKERLRGIRLVLNMLATAGRTAWTLRTLKPDVVIISKPLPANVLGVLLFTWLYKLSASTADPPSVAGKLVLDADDFELTANSLSSIAQRGAIHWSERQAAKLARAIVVASPFLSDHFKQLTQSTKPVTIIPTGLSLPKKLKAAGGASGVLHPQLSIITYLGSVSVSSGHRVDLLPDILERSRVQLSNIQLLIAGDGDDVAALKEELSRRNLTEQVTWFGRFTMTDLDHLITPHTIIIDPVDDSIANRAKSSFRVMLAAALGLPVVTSNIGIRPRLVPAQFHERFFADPNDAASYAQKVVALAQHPLTPDERSHLQEHATTYTWTKLATRYYDILTV